MGWHVVNETRGTVLGTRVGLADRFWPQGDAVGRTLITTGSRQEVTVVGVAEDVKIWSLQEPPRPYIYEPLAQNPAMTAHLVVRGDAAPGALGRGAAATLAGVAPELFVPRIATMREHLSYILFLPRMAAWLVGGFALLALVLSAVGLWGIVSYGVARRTREMGIRMSLGADARSVVRLLVRDGLGLVTVGALLGTALSVASAQLLSGFLFGVEAIDPLTLTVVPLLIIAVGAGAALIPFAIVDVAALGDDEAEVERGSPHHVGRVVAAVRDVLPDRLLTGDLRGDQR